MKEKIEIEPQQYVVFEDLTPFTVLELKRDPGLSFVLYGGVMLMLGTCLALTTKQKKQEDRR